MVIIGIDPGATGALAVVELVDPDHVDVFDMPTVQVKRGARMVREVDPAQLADYLRVRITCSLRSHAYVERVHSMPGQGVSSMFAFGRTLGMIEGVLAALEIPITHVPPHTWTRAMGVQGGKDGSRKRAGELFPKQANLFARVKDDGRADACLIALWGAKQK